MVCCLLSVGIAGVGGSGGSRNDIESENPKKHLMNCVYILPYSGYSTKGDDYAYWNLYVNYSLIIMS